MNQRLSTLAAHWKKFPVAPGIGVGNEDILLFEKTNDVRLPNDLREFFKCFDGWDDVEFRFLRLSELHRPSLIQYQQQLACASDRNTFVIVDYLQWCWWYTIDLTESTVSEAAIRLGGTLDDRVIARTFSGFLDLYLADDPTLYPRALEHDR